MTTKKKRQPKPEKDEETDRRAAVKLTRLLADTRTTPETRGA